MFRSLAIASLFALAIASTYGRLAFAPVPWPDGSAFFLPGVDWVNWPPQWRMHAQAAFVPSYDQANFNTMPALPLLLGIAHRLGLSTLLGATALTRLMGFAALGGFLWFLMGGLRANSIRSRWIAAVLFCAIAFDPVIRWGTTVARTEIWVLLTWAAVLFELSRPKPREWVIGLALGLAAYFHFEAIILVPAVMAALPGPRSWIKIGGWTTLALSPWLLYGATHFPLFVEQMRIQFGRMKYIYADPITPYWVFHSMFNGLGSPVSYPKFFNVGKALFWLITFGLVIHCVMHPSRRSRGAAVGFAASLILYYTKREAWFVALAHGMWAAWLAVAISERPKRWLTAEAGAFGLLSIAALLTQYFQISPEYRYDHFKNWSECIESKIPSHSRVWQPYAPDDLVELAAHRPDLDLYRAFDFAANQERLQAFLETHPVLLLTGFKIGALTENDRGIYSGPPRVQDLERMHKDDQVPYGGLGLKYPEQLWICQFGPFWAGVSI